MAKLSADAPVPISFWAVARIANTSQVVVKFNDLPAVVMNAEQAKEFAAAINAELEKVDCAFHMQPMVSLA